MGGKTAQISGPDPQPKPKTSNSNVKTMTFAILIVILPVAYASAPPVGVRRDDRGAGERHPTAILVR